MEFNVGTVDLKFVVGLPALLYLFYCVYWEWTVGIQRRRLIKQNGCKPIRNHEEFNGFPKNVIGIKIIKENVKALREHRALEVLGSRHTRTANTIHHKTFFEDMIYTLEPENIKAMLATSFKDFGLSRRRQKAFIPLLGQGIFTSNGAAWQHSRDLLRPNFVRGQVGDLDTFESHVDQLISAIPADGSTFDLQSLFFQLTIDTATEFLFGESTNTLGSSASNEEKVRFAQAFNRSQEEIAYSIRSAKLHPWFRTKQFWEDCRYVHEFADRYVSRGLQYRQSMLEKNMGKEKSTTGGDEDGGRYVFLHELVKSIADPIRIRSELLNVLLAGRDTTASLLSGLFFVISRRPDVWNKLKAEVDQLRGQTPTFQQLKDMKYLRMTMNESMSRHFPFFPIFWHCSASSFPTNTHEHSLLPSLLRVNV